MVASGLVCLTLEQAIQVGALASDIALFFTVKMPLPLSLLHPGVEMGTGKLNDGG